MVEVEFFSIAGYSNLPVDVFTRVIFDNGLSDFGEILEFENTSKIIYMEDAPKELNREYTMLFKQFYEREKDYIERLITIGEISAVEVCASVRVPQNLGVFGVTIPVFGKETINDKKLKYYYHVWH